MMSLRDHLARQFPALEFVWIAEHPRTWTVKGQAGQVEPHGNLGRNCQRGST